MTVKRRRIMEYRPSTSLLASHWKNMKFCDCPDELTKKRWHRGLWTQWLIGKMSSTENSLGTQSDIERLLKRYLDLVELSLFEHIRKAQ